MDKLALVVKTQRATGMTEASTDAVITVLGTFGALDDEEGAGEGATYIRP